MFIAGVKKEACESGRAKRLSNSWLQQRATASESTEVKLRAQEGRCGNKRAVSYPHQRKRVSMEQCEHACQPAVPPIQPRKDYVNLADLESCCAKHRRSSAFLPQSVSLGASISVKHCDRHCHCRQHGDTTGNRPTRSPPNRQSLPLAPKNFPPVVCSCPLLCCSKPPNNSLPAPKENKENTRPVAGEKRKHRLKRKEKSMQQVEEWIIKEAGADSVKLENNNQEYNMQKTTQVTVGKNKVTIEHRHYHEHRHLIVK